MATLSDSTSENAVIADTEVVALREEVAELKHQLEWFKKQLFGSKSEKRIEEHPDQLRLFGKKQAPTPQDQPKQTATYETSLSSSTCPAS